MRLELALAAGLLASFSAQAPAQEATQLQKVNTARALYEIGLANDDALLILAAAKLRKEVPLTQTERAPEGRRAEDGAPLEWQEMLASALPLIEGNPILMGISEDIEAERSKGVTDGPVYSVARIASGGRDVYDNLPFDGGTYAEIYLEGPSGSDLNLMIRDSKGRLVCSDTDISAIAYCGWKPLAADVFQVTVESARGGGKYSLMSN